MGKSARAGDDSWSVPTAGRFTRNNWRLEAGEEREVVMIVYQNLIADMVIIDQ